jgi:hypothetical protein
MRSADATRSSDVVYAGRSTRVEITAAGDPFAQRVVQLNQAMSSRHPVRSQSASVLRLQEEREATVSFGFAPAGEAGRVYDEQAFRYFLNIETKRAERSGRPLVFVLIDQKGLPGAHADIEPTLARQLLGALSQGLRETDFVGWYQAQRVVGAVLTQSVDGAGTDIANSVRERVGHVIAFRIAPAPASLLQVRVFQIPSKTKGWSE